MTLGLSNRGGTPATGLIQRLVFLDIPLGATGCQTSRPWQFEVNPAAPGV